MAKQIIVTQNNYGILLETQFIDDAKNPIDLTGYSVTVEFEYLEKCFDVLDATIINAEEGRVGVILEQKHTAEIGLYKTQWSVVDDDENVTAQEDIYYFVKKEVSAEGNEGENQEINIDTQGVVDKFKKLDETLLEHGKKLTEVEEARGTSVNLKERLDEVDLQIEDLSINGLMIDKINPHTNKLGYVIPEMFGKIDDGIDVTTILQDCIDYAIENNVKVVFTNNKEYCFTNLTIAKPCSIDFNNAILKSYNDDPNTSLLNIGLGSDSFETKTSYSSRFNISNILVDLDYKQKKYGVEINCRHLRINRIVVKKATNNGVYCGGNDGIWIDQILCFGNNTNTTSKGVVINCNDIILGNVECAYFKNGVYVQSVLNDIEINKLHVWSDVEESSCIAYGSNSFYGHINSLIIDSTNYGIDLNLVNGYGKLSIDNIMVFPSTNFPEWQVVREKFTQQSMGITIGAIFGILDTDETLRFRNFHGIIKSLSNYNQRPKIYAEYSNMSGSGHFFEQINGFLYQTEFAQITISQSSNRVDLGFTIGINKLWDKIAVPVIIVGSDYNPISANACIMITKDNGFVLRLSEYLIGTYRIKIACPLPAGYYY